MSDPAPPTPRKRSPRQGPASGQKAHATRAATPEDVEAAAAATMAAMHSPSGEAPKPKAEKVPRPTGGTARGLEARLAEFFGSFSLAFTVAGDEHCATIIAQGAPELARAWADLARQNAGVNRVLTRLVEGSAWGGVMLSTGAIVLPIAMHHGLKIPGPMGAIFQTSGAAFSPGDEGSVPPAPHTAPSRNGGGGMTPPISADQPPGVVTVDGGPSRAVFVPGA